MACGGNSDMGETEEREVRKLRRHHHVSHYAKHGLWVAFKAAKLDGRTGLAKRIAALKADLIKQLGHPPSPGEAILIERAVHKSIQCLLYELGVFQGDEQKRWPGSRDHYLALANSLRLDLVSLGIKGGGEKVPNLTEYLKKKSADAEKGDEP